MTLKEKFRNVESIYDLTIMDDYMSSKIFSDRTIVSEFLSIILKRTVHIVRVRTQVQVRPGKKSHYVVYDVIAIDDQGDIYNLEIQDYDEKDFTLRLTYNAGILITKALKKGEAYSKLRKTTVIALCSSDPVGSGKTYYESEYPFENEPGQKMRPRTKMIALNANGEKSSGNMDIDLLMDYIKTSRRNKGRLTVLLDDARFRLCKDEKEQEAFMTELYQGQHAGDVIARKQNKEMKKEIERMKKEAVQNRKENDQIKEEAAQNRKRYEEEKKNSALKLHEDGMDIDKIAGILNAEPAQINDWVVRENEQKYNA